MLSTRLLADLAPLSPSSQGIFHWILLTIFCTVAITPEHQDATMFVPVSLPQLPHTYMFQYLTLSEVLSQLLTLDIRKSVGPDGISARLMKEVAAEIASLLVYIFNKSLQDGCVPRMWKCSSVTPVHKGGSVVDPSNNRPISVISVAAKVFEKLTATQLQTYLEEQKLLHPHQGAYRHGWSSDDILLHAVDSIIQELDKKHIVYCAFLDLVKPSIL